MGASFITYYINQNVMSKLTHFKKLMTLNIFQMNGAKRLLSWVKHQIDLCSFSYENEMANFVGILAIYKRTEYIWSILLKQTLLQFCIFRMEKRKNLIKL